MDKTYTNLAQKFKGILKVNKLNNENREVRAGGIRAN